MLETRARSVDLVSPRRRLVLGLALTAAVAIPSATGATARGATLALTLEPRSVTVISLEQ